MVSAGRFPEPRDAGPVGGARHTLGSSPESQEPAEPAELRSLPVAETHPADAEPHHTIHVEGWRDARQRIARLDSSLKALLGPLLDHVEAGWAHIRPLQRWYEAEQEHARAASDDYALLLDFIDGDVVDLFRELAAAVAAMVPGYRGWEAEADPGGVEGELDRFVRYFTVFCYAVEAADAPEGLRAEVRAAVQGLEGWSTEFTVLVAAIDKAVIAPLYRRGHRALS